MINNETITVLYVVHSNNMSGANQSLYDLLISVGNKIKPIVLLPDSGPAEVLFSSLGAKIIVCPFTRVIKPRFSWARVGSIIIHPWRIYPIKNLIWSIRCIYVVKKCLKGEVPDIVHTNTSLTTIGVLLSRVFDAKHVWHIRERIDGKHFGKLAVRYSRYIRRINEASARIVISVYCQMLKNLKKENTVLLLDAVRSKKDSCYERIKQPYILFCSNYITETKGVNMVIRSFMLSNLAYRGIRLKIVGNYSNSLVEDVCVSGCSDAIDIIPFQKDVKPIFAHASAFINASVDEGMGRTTVEAMFFGCPVVALASGGTLDLIKNGETGYLFTTEEECANLLKMVCNTNQEKVIKQAQEFAIKNMSIENYGDKIMKIYKNVMTIVI